MLSPLANPVPVPDFPTWMPIPDRFTPEEIKLMPVHVANGQSSVPVLPESTSSALTLALLLENPVATSAPHIGLDPPVLKEAAKIGTTPANLPPPYPPPSAN